MLGRVIWKMVLAISVALAIAVIVFIVRTRRSDLVLSAAGGGTYRELRLGHGRVGVTLIPKWPTDERLRMGRATTRPVVLYRPNSTARSIGLLDGTQLSLQWTTPARSWKSWPPLREQGIVSIEGAPKARPTTMPAGFLVLNSTSTSRPLTFSGTTIKGAPGFTVPAPTTAPGSPPPTLSVSGWITSSTTMPVPSSPATPATQPITAAYAISAAYRGNGSFTVGVGPGGLPTISSSSGTLTITGGSVFILKSYDFERYAVSAWSLAAVVLLPVWCAIALALARLARRRSRHRRGLCEACAYDLRGSPAGGACPECGAATTINPAPPSGQELLARLR